VSASFEEQGYAVFDNAFAPAVIEDLRRDAERLRDDLLRRMIADQALDPRVTWWRLESGSPYLLKIKPVLATAPAAATLAADPFLTTTISGLLGSSVLLMEDKFMYKQRLDVNADWANLPQLGEEVCKHTDAAYFRARGYDRVITVAVCLDDCTADAGALMVWPGTHRRSLTMVDTERQGPVVADEDAPDEEAVILTATAGSVLAWDSGLVHASGPNTSGNPRRLFVLGYTGQDAAERCGF
jgi:hypothetical protein